MNRKLSAKALLLILFLAVAVFRLGRETGQALDTGLALTPPMGWNSWNKSGCKINGAIVREIADAMVSSGMKEAGYQYKGGFSAAVSSCGTVMVRIAL